jgi:hypothetical protein
MLSDYNIQKESTLELNFSPSRPGSDGFSTIVSRSVYEWPVKRRQLAQELDALVLDALVLGGCAELGSFLEALNEKHVKELDAKEQELEAKIWALCRVKQENEELQEELEDKGVSVSEDRKNGAVDRLKARLREAGVDEHEITAVLLPPRAIHRIQVQELQEAARGERRGGGGEEKKRTRPCSFFGRNPGGGGGDGTFF